MQATDSYHRTPRRAGRQRLVLLVALAQPGQELSDLGRRHLADLGPAGGGQRRSVPLQVPAVRLDRVDGQAALDG